MSPKASNISFPWPRIPGYTISEQLYAGSRTMVYRAMQDAQQRSVIIKILRQAYPTFNELVQFRNQYTITKNLGIPGIVRPLSLEPYQNSYALVMEDCQSISLEQYARHQPLGLTAALNIALQLAEILHHLHHSQIIHKDIKPANILIHPETQQIKLIDFSIASLLPKETQEIQTPTELEGTLAYIAPEQTGRMNRGIDYRADFYSFGVTLYKLLTGQLPFPINNPLEVVHCHIAKLPVPPDQIRSTIPAMVSEIVLKLMAKNAEDRYQSALGLKYDLQLCLKQWQRAKTILEFKLGQQDRSDRFVIPEKLYGREKEVQTLLQAFERTARGTAEIMLVAGFSGIGKTAVINEVHKPITRQQGYFIKGKFDQFNRNIPFSAFVQALRDLIGQLLSESDAQLTQWRTQILEAVGENGQVLIKVIPELERIIGKQPPASKLSGIAAQNRFNLLFQKFIEVFTTPEHPLVIFLDDLQWADSASLLLIKLLANGANSQYLLIIGAYRDNEVSEIHPLMLTVLEIKKAGATVNLITLKPLLRSHLNHLIADTLICSTALTQPLTDLVYQKTKGNPFFSTQFLKSLYEDQLITFNETHHYWECDITQVRSLTLTDNVLEFMALQLQKLPEPTQKILKLAACIGNQFDLETLAIVSKISSIEAATNLWKALQEGFILPVNTVYKFYQNLEEESFIEPEFKPPSPTQTGLAQYKFLHDRVQQAAYYLIPESDQAIAHYQIGQLLLARLSPEAREEQIFDLVNQINYGIPFIEAQSDRDQLAQLNWIAGCKARTATAYQAARIYAENGLILLGEQGWQRHYEMSLSLHELAAEVASLCGEFKQMDRWINTAIACAKTPVDRVGVYLVKIQTLATQNKLLESISIALSILKELGIEFPEQSTLEDTQQAIQDIKTIIGDQPIENLIHLPPMNDAEKLGIMQVAASITTSSYIVGSPLLPLIIAVQVKLSLQYGNSLISGYSYATYSVILNNLFQELTTAFRFGQVAYHLAAEPDGKTIRSEAFNVLAVFVFHRQSHALDTLPIFEAGYQAGLETGKIESAGQNAFGFSIHSYWCGQGLADLQFKIRAYRQQLLDLNVVTAANYCSLVWEATLFLTGNSELIELAYESTSAEEKLIAQAIEANDLLRIFYFHLNKAILNFLLEDYQEASANIVQARQYILTSSGLMGEAVLYFYDSLIAMPTGGGYAIATQRKSQQQIQDNQAQLKAWADYAPMNYLHKWQLVEAEKYRLLGQKREAIEHYEKAISGAKKNQYLQEEALALELAAKFYLNWGKEKIAAGYMQDAYYCYARWGAKAKTEDLERRYPDLLRPILLQPNLIFNPLETLATLISPNPSNHTADSATSLNAVLDFATILKASQSISRTIQLDELLYQLTQIILQNSGGDRCALIIPNQEQIFQIKAIATSESTELCSEFLDNNSKVPVKLIQYVKNTQQMVVIDNGKLNLPIIEPYFQQQHPQSVLALPIIHQGKLMGILYLENQFTAGVFTNDRIVVLNFLCTQAAISLENARLYQQAQNYSQQLEQSQLQLIQSEKMSALGNLVAGVAHEMNNPVGFLYGNINEAINSVRTLTQFLKLYQENFPDPGRKILENAEEKNIKSQVETLNKLLKAMKTECDRIKGISTSLRIFCRADENNKITFNLHEGIDSTLLILKHRLNPQENRPAIEVVKHYGEFAVIKCFPGQINQAFMNILNTLIDGFDQESDLDFQINPPKITIQSAWNRERNAIEIRIHSNGNVIPEAVKAQISDAVLINPNLKKATGLGLAIAYQIVVEKHKGTLTTNAEVGQGTEFLLRLPIRS